MASQDYLPEEKLRLAKANPGMGVVRFLCKIYDIDKSMARERVPGILNLFDIHRKETGEDLYQLLNDVRNVQNEDFWDEEKGRKATRKKKFDWSEVVPIRERESIEEHRLDYLRSPGIMSHIDLLDYRKIWSTIQEAPSTASAARELGLNLSRVHKIEDMLDGFYVNGALEDWLRIVERLRSIQRERRKEFGAALDVKWDHKRDPLLMDLRVMFADFVRDPVSIDDRPSVEDVDWVYQRLLMEEQGIDEEPEDDTSPGSGFDLSGLEQVLADAAEANFGRSQGAWRQFEDLCEAVTGCGWKMGMVKHSSGKDNAINRMYTTGMIRAYPQVLVHALFIEDFLEEMTRVYRTEFGERMRCSPVMALIMKNPEGTWRARRILVQDRHPLMPFSREDLLDYFPSSEIVTVETSPLELTDGWEEGTSSTMKDTISLKDRSGKEASPEMGGEHSLRQVMEDVLSLQPMFDSTNTPIMSARGHLVRKIAPEALRPWAEPHGLSAEGRDGTGRKTRVPWFRAFSETHSPSATTGWYLVYLFAFDGSAVFLSLNQGTTDFKRNQFVAKPPSEISARRGLARNKLGVWRENHQHRFVFDIDLRDSGSLAKGYSLGNVVSLRYEAGHIPDDTSLREDFDLMAGFLNEIQE